jgi:nicotinate dehydrogenase subunit A
VQFHLDINGQMYPVDGDPETPLIYVLRNDLDLSSVRFGCGEEQCGACRVLIDNDLAFACTLTLAEVGNRRVTTVEGLSTGAQLHPLQAAFISENAAQCGYCASGVLLAAAHLLQHNPAPSRWEIQQALAGNLCRCGAHNRIIRAVQRAASELSDGR